MGLWVSKRQAARVERRAPEKRVDIVKSRPISKLRTKGKGIVRQNPLGGPKIKEEESGLSSDSRINIER